MAPMSHSNLLSFGCAPCCISRVPGLWVSVWVTQSFEDLGRDIRGVHCGMVTIVRIIVDGYYWTLFFISFIFL